MESELGKERCKGMDMRMKEKKEASHPKCRVLRQLSQRNEVGAGI